MRFEFCDSRRLLENQAPIIGLARQNLGDVPLRHDAVAGAPDSRPHEKLLDIFQPARSLVEEIFAPTIAKHPPGNRHFAIFDFHPRGDQMLFVHPANRQRHLSHAERPAAIGAVEDDIGHFATAQSFGRLFAQYPSNRVRNVGFTAAIGTHNRGDARLEIKRRFVGERFEPKNCEIF